MFQNTLNGLIISLKNEVTNLAKKMKTTEDFMYHMYVHMNEIDRFVIFSGLTLQQFVSSVEPLQHLLLLKHDYEDGSFNMHTQFDFVTSEEINRFTKKVSDSSKELCWIDFNDEKHLNRLTPVEQAELLYIKHKREPISSVFFHKLQNRYVYISSRLEKYTKIYFRQLSDADLLVSKVFNAKIQEKENVAGFWRRKSKANTPSLSPEILRSYRLFAQDGALLSLFKMENPKSYGIEIRNLDDYSFPDEVWDDLNVILKSEHDEIIHIS